MRRGNRDRVVQNRCVAVDRSGPWKMGLVDALAESLQEKAYCSRRRGLTRVKLENMALRASDECLEVRQQTPIMNSPFGTSIKVGVRACVFRVLVVVSLAKRSVKTRTLLIRTASEAGLVTHRAPRHCQDSSKCTAHHSGDAFLQQQCFVMMRATVD